MIVIAAQFGGIAHHFHGGGAAEFPTPDDEGVVEHAALFEVAEQRGDGLINFRGEFAVIHLNVVMVIPWLAGPMPELYVAHAPFEEAPGDQGLPAMHPAAVEVADVLRLACGIEGVGGLRLHAEGEFEGLKTGVQSGIGAFAAVRLIEGAQQIELPPLVLRSGVGTADIANQAVHRSVLGVHKGALMRAGQKGRLPVLRAFDRITAGTHRDESWQVLILGAEPIHQP